MQLTFRSKLMQAREEAYKRQHPEAELPESFFRDLMDDQLGRGYLAAMPPADQWMLEKCGLRGDFGWLRFTRLPITPGKEEENTLLESWQSVLSACHTMGLSLAFVLLRRKGETEVYIGARAKGGETAYAREKLGQCMAIHMPGAELQPPAESAHLEETLENYTHCGVMTGIPSLRSDRSGVTLQTLDKLARGIRVNKKEKTYALVILADAVGDRETTQLQQRFLNLKSEIHQFIGYSAQESFNEGASRNTNIGTGMGADRGQGSLMDGVQDGLSLGGILEALAMSLMVTGNPVGAAGAGTLSFLLARVNLHGNISGGKSFGTSTGVTREFRDFTAKYCEDLVDRNIARLERGRNLGFWQTGVYVLTEDDVTTDSVLGMLRSVYSGKESFVEPLRAINAGRCEAVADYIGRLQMLPLPGSAQDKKAIGEELGLGGNSWHVLGRMYEYFTTALTTEELSIASSLPRREVPGLRMVRCGVQFANNTGEKAKNGVELGRLVDMGVRQEAKYAINPDAMVRHILVGGITGSGKTTTCKKIIKGVRSRGIPVMIIEPAKDDYVRWAIEQNRSLPEEERYTIIMPGATSIEGVRPRGLQLNLFQPAAHGDAPVSIVQHTEMAATLLNACLPSEEVIPILIEEAVHECMDKAAQEEDVDLTQTDNPQMTLYPVIRDLIAAGEEIVDAKTYEKRTKENFKEILLTRFKYLQRGTRGQILDCPVSTDFETLFSRPVVINLSRLSGSKDKSLVMSLILLALKEYRASRYEHDEAYREECRKNRLMHLLVLEEAHSVLTRPEEGTDSGNPQKAAAELFGDMLSEIRSYGQGMMLVDQVPTRLIDDAVKNTNYKIAHRMVARDDVELMGSAMMLRPDQRSIIPSLEVGNAIICGDMDDAASWIKVER